MSPRPPVKRPKLERTEPIRNWTTLLGGAAEPSAAASEVPESEQPAGTAGAAAPFGDAIARSVDLGYRVVDEYVRQGQKAAERLTGRSAAPEAMAADMQDAAMRMAQYASDFAGLWFETLGVARGDDGFAVPSAPPAGGASAAGVPASSDGTRVLIEVASVHPVEVMLDLRPTAARCPLSVEPLRAVDPDLPPLGEVGFTHAGDEPLRLRLRVAAEQPAGVYNGLVTDEDTNRPVGTVSVRVCRA